MRMGVVGMSKTLAKEVGKDNILVNVIGPGRISGQMSGQAFHGGGLQNKVIVSTLLSRIVAEGIRVCLGGLQRDMERRINASQPGLCPVDMSLKFLPPHNASDRRCSPRRPPSAGGTDFRRGAHRRTQVIADSADCAIGYEAAHMVLKGVRGFREDYEEHVLHGRCICGLSHPVPCVSTCPAHVDIPGYVAANDCHRFAGRFRPRRGLHGLGVVHRITPMWTSPAMWPWSTRAGMRTRCA